MANSTGDQIVNQEAFDNEQLLLAKVSLEDQEKSEKLFDLSKSEDATFKPLDINSIIAVDQNNDGSVKWTFDNIYENKTLAGVARDYYSERTGKVYTDRQAIDKYIADRTWKQANTFSMGKEYAYITGKWGDAGKDQKARLAYLTREWHNLPNFYEEGGRGLSGFAANMGVALLDPLNLIGGVVGGIVGKGATKAVGKTLLAKEVGKVTGKEIIKDVTPETFAGLASKAAKSNLLKSAGTIAAIDAVGFSAADIANQTVEKEIGARKKLDPWRTATVAIAAGGTSFFAVGGLGLATRYARNIIAKNATDLPTGLHETLKIGGKLTDENINSKMNVRKTGVQLRANLADQYDFVKVLQKNILGVEGSAAGLKRAVESGKFPIDPVLMPYFQMRMAAAAATRSHEFILHGFYLPPSATSKTASYTKGHSKGLQEIVLPFDKVSQTNAFLIYAAAKRQQGIIKTRPKLKEKLPLTEKEMQAAIDFGEMSASSWFGKYGTKLTRKGNYTKGLEDLKVFTDEALEYQVLSGLLSKKAAEKIKTDNPYFVPFYRKEKSGIRKVLQKQTDKLILTSRPGAKRLAKERLEGDLNLYDNLVTYVYKTLNGSDRNRAKLALYDMIAKAKKLGMIDKDALVRNASYDIESKTVIGANVKAKYEQAGFKIIGGDDKILPNLDVAVFSGTYKRQGKNFIDIVYRDGKGEAYEILHPELAEAFVAFGDDTIKHFLEKIPLFRPGGFAPWVSRYSSRAITYSPPFVAYNIVRDTLAGAVNSVFGIVNKHGVGYVPGWTTVKGLINSYRANDVYRKALIDGLGYSSRSEMEALITTASRDMLKYGAAREVKFYVGALKNFKRKMSSGARWYADFVSRVEYATRLGEYQLAKSAGLSDLASSFLGREVATDFGMRGSSRVLQLLSRNTMFLNAGLQGLYRTGRLAFEGNLMDKGRVGLAIGGVLVAPELFLYSINRKIPEYHQLDERVRQLNYVIPLYETDVDGNDVFDGFFFVPKPYDLGVFPNIAVALVKGIEEKTPEVGLRYALQSLGNIIPGLPIPQLFNPAMEIWMNKNNYTGSPVLGFYEQAAINAVRYRASTREIAKKAFNFLVNMKGLFTANVKEGKIEEAWFDLDPVKIDYLIKAYAVGLMQYPVDILNTMLLEPIGKGNYPGTEKLRKMLGIETEKGISIVKPSKRVDEIDVREPWTIVTRRFRTEKSIKNSFFHKEWYRIRERAKKLGVLDVTNLDDAREINAKFFLMLDRIKTNIDNNEPLQEDEVTEYVQILGPTFEAVLTHLQDTRNARKTIEASPGMSPDMKRTQMNQLLVVENMILQQYFNLLVRMDLDYVLSDTMSKFGVGVELKTHDLPESKKKKRELKLEEFK